MGPQWPIIITKCDYNCPGRPNQHKMVHGIVLGCYIEVLTSLHVWQIIAAIGSIEVLMLLRYSVFCILSIMWSPQDRPQSTVPQSEEWRMKMTTRTQTTRGVLELCEILKLVSIVLVIIIYHGEWNRLIFFQLSFSKIRTDCDGQTAVRWEYQVCSGNNCD